MTKEQFKAMLTEMIVEGELQLSIRGYSSENYHYITVGIEIDGEILTETEADLEKNY